MQDKSLRKAFGSRIKKMRKQKRWTQKDLAAKLDVQFGQVNKYESGLHAPPVEKLAELAELFGTTIDYLITGDATEASPIHNMRLLERFRALQALEPDDQETVIKLIDAMIVRRRVEGAILPLEQHTG